MNDAQKKKRLERLYSEVDTHNKDLKKIQREIENLNRTLGDDAATKYSEGEYLHHSDGTITTLIHITAPLEERSGQYSSFPCQHFRWDKKRNYFSFTDPDNVSLVVLVQSDFNIITAREYHERACKMLSDIHNVLSQRV